MQKDHAASQDSSFSGVASHVCFDKTLSRRRDARAGGTQGIFLCRNVHRTDFRRGGKACGDLLSGSRGERDEEHDKELTERLECQENLLRTFFQGKEDAEMQGKQVRLRGNNSFWISHTIYHGSRPMVPTPMPVYRRRGKFVHLWLSDIASSGVHQHSKGSVFLRLDSGLLTKRTNTRHT